MTLDTDHSRAAAPPQPSFRMPYFDLLLLHLEAGKAGHDVIEPAFGRHVHWGYWPDPAAATGDAADYGNAAERLASEVIAAARISDGTTVLDVGCGFGGTLAILNELALAGINIDQRQIARARKNHATQRLLRRAVEAARSRTKGDCGVAAGPRERTIAGRP